MGRSVQSGEHDVVWTENEDGSRTMEKGPNNTFKVDVEGMKEYQARIDEGFMLFGKYYENLGIKHGMLLGTTTCKH